MGNDSVHPGVMAQKRCHKKTSPSDVIPKDGPGSYVCLELAEVGSILTNRPIYNKPTKLGDGLWRWGLPHYTHN